MGFSFSRALFESKDRIFLSVQMLVPLGGAGSNMRMRWRSENCWLARK